MAEQEPDEALIEAKIRAARAFDKLLDNVVVEPSPTGQDLIALFPETDPKILLGDGTQTNRMSQKQMRFFLTETPGSDRALRKGRRARERAARTTSEHK